MTKFSKEQLKKARRTELIPFLKSYHMADIIAEGNSVRLKNNHGVSIKNGYTGYFDFKTGDKGNSVDFLVNYLGYDLGAAVLALNGESGGSMSRSTYECNKNNNLSSNTRGKNPTERTLSFPEKSNSLTEVIEYLQFRGISKATIKKLIEKNILYQDIHNNAVFINPERDYCEIRGTYRDKPFHGVRKSIKDRLWYIKDFDGIADVVYVCEAAIDSISLYELRKVLNLPSKAIFASIGGVANQDTIERIKGQYQTIIAVDNDEAGMICRVRNFDCDVLIPKNKDWNEDLLQFANEKIF